MKEMGRLITAMITPMKEDGSVDYEQAKVLANKLVDSGSDGVVVVGTTGESPTLVRPEELRLFAEVKDAIGDRASVIAGTGSNATAEAIEATIQAEDIGVDACLLVVPYYNKPSQEGLYQHFKAIAQSISIPLCLYNLPARCVVNMQPETVERLMEFDNIIGLKEGNSDMVHVSEIHRRCGDRLTILSGDDPATLAMLAVGAKGVVSVAGNIIPDVINTMISNFMNGNVAEARKIHEKYLPFFGALFYETNPVPVKTAMRKIGLAADGVRLPMVEMSEANKAKLFSVMDQVGISK